MIDIPGTSAMERKPVDQGKLDELRELAVALGCDGVTIISSREIVIDSKLADLCHEPRCQNYGLSPTCPPHVEGSEWIEAYLKGTSRALFLKIEADHDVMYSDQRREIGKLLHFIVAQIEKAAHEMGLTQSRAFAGGSCKNIFCYDHHYCEVLQGDGTCRNPDSARPSVSGYGININHLINIAGWSPMDMKDENRAVSLARYGLVILGV